MLHKFFNRILLPALLLLLLASCKDDFTTDSAYKLTYSTDTLSFDTIFTNQLSTTQVIKVYNDTKKDIRINSVSLLSEYGKHYFMINFNGKSGTHFENAEILSGDSLFIFVQLMMDELGSKTPLQINEHLVFNYNDNHEYMVLSAFGQDVHRMKKVHITRDTTWHNEKPYLIYDTLFVDEGASLTIDEGTILYMHDGSTFEVNGRLIINGTAESNVLFRGDRFDWLTSSTSYDMVNNQWGGIHITATSTGNHINGAYIRNGAFGIQIDSADILPNQPRLILGNSTIHNEKQFLIGAIHANLYAYNCVLSNGENGGVRLQGGEYLFNHCSMGSFNKGHGTYRYSVVLSNQDVLQEEGPSMPIRTTFNNCIIIGTEYEIFLNKAESETDFDYLFNHCFLVKGGIEESELTDAHFRGSHFTGNSTEKDEYNTYKSISTDYDFHLLEGANARGIADPEILELYPECQTDKDGRVREAQEIDPGAFIFVQEEKEPE